MMSLLLLTTFRFGYAMASRKSNFMPLSNIARTAVFLCPFGKKSSGRKQRIRSELSENTKFEMNKAANMINLQKNFVKCLTKLLHVL